MSRLTDDELDDLTARVAVAAINYLCTDQERFVAAVHEVFARIEARATEREREACARIAERALESFAEIMPMDVPDAIRARGTK